jgi:hypothetical protein
MTEEVASALYKGSLRQPKVAFYLKPLALDSWVHQETDTVVVIKPSTVSTLPYPTPISRKIH